MATPIGFEPHITCNSYRRERAGGGSPLEPVLFRATIVADGSLANRGCHACHHIPAVVGTGALVPACGSAAPWLPRV